MSDREVMQQALEALLWADAQGENWQQVVKKAIKPIQEAAAQPEPVQEPFGYLWPTGSHPEFRFTQQKRDGADGMPLYTAPPQQQAEPVAWGCNRYIEDDNGFQIGTDDPELAWGKYAPDDNGWWPLYTSAPQRKPLTEAQQVDCLVKSGCIETVKMSFESGPYDITRPSINASMLIEAVEAAHGIKEMK